MGVRRRPTLIIAASLLWALPGLPAGTTSRLVAALLSARTAAH